MPSINMTQIVNYTPTQLIEWAHSTTAVPTAIVITVSALLIFLVIGLLVIKRASWGKYLTIWISSAVILSSVLLAVIYLPDTIQKIADFFRNFLS